MLYEVITYEPIVKLIAPTKIQIATVLGSYEPSEKTKIDFEVAVSNVITSYSIHYTKLYEKTLTKKLYIIFNPFVYLYNL